MISSVVHPFLQYVDPWSIDARTFSIDPGGRMTVAASIRNLFMRDADQVGTVAAALSVVRIGAGGKLDCVLKYDIDVGGTLRQWIEAVPL